MPSGQRLRDSLMVALAVTTGATDAVAFERLGHVFASVITGNLILLGVSAVSGDGATALFAGCALAGYACGVFAAAPRRREKDTDNQVWPAGATVALSLDLALLIAFAVGWEVAGDKPGRAAQTLLLVCTAAAMGVQSTAVRRVGQISTTYLTSTLTGVVEALAWRTWSRDHSRSVAIITAAVAGAAAATGLILHARAWLPAVQLVPLVSVIVISRRLIGLTVDSA